MSTQKRWFKWFILEKKRKVNKVSKVFLALFHFTQIKQTRFRPVFAMPKPDFPIKICKIVSRICKICRFSGSLTPNPSAIIGNETVCLFLTIQNRAMSAATFAFNSSKKASPQRQKRSYGKSVKTTQTHKNLNIIFALLLLYRT